MTAIRKNLLVDSGTTWNLSVRYRDSNRVPVDLTGYTATLSTYTPGKENGTPLFQKTAGLTNDGWINVKVTDEETALWGIGKKAYTLDLENSGGDKDRLFFGALEVRSNASV